MNTLRQILARLEALVRRGRREREMQEEMALHLEMQTEANRARGMDAETARYAALRQFGGVAQLQERCREQRGWLWLDALGRDLRHAARLAVRAPGFSAAVLVTLACGIGATTAVFSGVNALWLRPLPVRAPDGLVVAAATGPGAGTGDFPYPLFDRSGVNRPFPYPFLTAFRERCTTLTEVIAVTAWPMQRALLASGFGATEPESVVVEEVSGNYFAGLGVPIALGRPLSVADDQPAGVEPVAVVSHEFWRRRLNGDPAAVGKVVRIDGHPVTIVGVAASGFAGTQVGLRCALWLPIQQSQVLDEHMPWGRDAIRQERWPFIHILGRLRDGVSRQQAQAELDGLFQNKLAELDPRRRARPSGEGANPWLEQHLALAEAGTGYGGVRSNLQRPLAVLMALVAVLQLAACANVAGLLLARGAAREHELAVRASLGASRGRIVGQLLTECLFLAVLAAGFGVLLAVWAARFLEGGAGGLELAIDAPVLAFASAVTVVSAVAAGLVPAWRLSGHGLGGSLKPMRAVRSRLNAVLVAAQIGFAFVLLAVAGLFGRTLHNVATADTGFERRDRLLFDIGLAPETPPPERATVYQRIAGELENLGGVESASFYQGIDLLGDTAFVLDFDVPGLDTGPDPSRRASLVHVGPRFFATMGIPLLRGRDFGPRDEGAMVAGVPAIVIGEWAARHLFGEDEALGRRIRLGSQEFEVVGVAKDVKYGGLRDEPRFIFYLATSVTPNAMRMIFAVRTAGAPLALARSFRTAVQQVDARAQLSAFRTVAERVEGATARERFTARLAGFFGGFALTLSGLGLFGLLAFMVSRRTREIGIRIALGAPSRGVLGLVLGEGARLWMIGCGVGVLAAFSFARGIDTLLFQVAATDPLTYALAGATLFVVTAAACLVPAWRAVRIDPMEALRAE